MKAIIWKRYGPPEVLEMGEVEKPAPKDNEVLIRIHASTVTAGDSELRNLDFPVYFKLPLRIWIGIMKPRPNTIPGTELAGEIEAVGQDVRLLSEGDQVFGSAGLRLGANAEYICLPEEGAVIKKPANMNYDEAATVPFGGREALHFLRLGDLQNGQRILINGAGGSIGTFTVQLAKNIGAEVTAVDSTEKLDMLRSIGADHVVDYTREDYTRNGEIYDVIFDVVGKMSFSRSKGSLKHDGIYLLANPSPSQLVLGLWTRMTSGQKVIMQTASGSIEDLATLRELVEAGKLVTVIDKTYPLEQVPDAHRYVDTGRKKGNVVITVNADSTD